jgi:HK97 family phage prohead protease
MDKKIYTSNIELKEEGEPGEFQAVFSTFNVIDKDGDVTLPGAFEDGQKVRISYWGHRWQDLPVGKGTIGADDDKAWVDGKFFLDTEAGLETYKTVKNLEDLQEWSYGFDIVDSEMGKHDEQDVQFLKRLTVHEVSPVLLGAGIGTGTTSIKNEKETPDDTQTEGEVGDDKPSGDVQPDFKLKKKRLELYKLEVKQDD